MQFNDYIADDSRQCTNESGLSELRHYSITFSHSANSATIIVKCPKIYTSGSFREAWGIIL